VHPRLVGSFEAALRLFGSGLSAGTTESAPAADAVPQPGQPELPDQLVVIASDIDNRKKDVQALLRHPVFTPYHRGDVFVLPGKDQDPEELRPLARAQGVRLLEQRTGNSGSVAGGRGSQLNRIEFGREVRIVTQRKLALPDLHSRSAADLG
jgi:hypothetical protein